MKFWIPTNPFWYYAIIVLVIPFVVVNFVSQSWIARLLAYGGLVVGIPLIFLLYGLSKHLAATTKEDAPLVKKYGKKRMVLIWRIILLALALLFAFPLVPNFARDVVATLRGVAPEVRDGVIAEKSGGAFTGYFEQTIVLDNAYSNPANTFTAFEMPSRDLVVGKKYEILYLPHSRIIVQAVLLE
jgi:hypothetical protein